MKFRKKKLSSILKGMQSQISNERYLVFTPSFECRTDKSDGNSNNNNNTTHDGNWNKSFNKTPWKVVIIIIIVVR